MEGTFKLAQQVGSVGIYADLSIRVQKYKERGKFKIHLPEESMKQWEPGLSFGAAYFLSNSLEYDGLEIWIDSLDTNPVGSSVVIVAYVMIQALCIALDAKLKSLPNFDENALKFCFGK